MDISRASNFERFVFDLLDRNGSKVAALWQQLANDGQFDLSHLQAAFEQYGFAAGTSSHSDRLATIRDVYQRDGVLIDPHTADGVKVARQYLEPDVPMLVLETALPIKFADTIVEAIGQEPPRPGQFEGLESLPQRVHNMPCDVDLVKQYIVKHAV